MFFMFTLRQIGTGRKCEHEIFKAGAGVALGRKAAHAPIRARFAFDTDSHDFLRVGRASSRDRLVSLDWIYFEE